MAHVLSTCSLNVSFRRALTGDNLQKWYELVAKVVFVNLNEGNDIFKWDLNKSDIFSVRSMYLAWLQDGVVSYRNPLWQIRIPLKINFFLWYLYKGVILTKDNLAKRNWQENTKCCFCNSSESIQHLFFDCHFSRFI